MSDKNAIEQAIDKAALELVEELVSAGKKGGEQWFKIIKRKMESLPLDRRLEESKNPDARLNR